MLMPSASEARIPESRGKYLCACFALSRRRRSGAREGAGRAEQGAHAMQEAQNGHGHARHTATIARQTPIMGNGFDDSGAKSGRIGRAIAHSAPAPRAVIHRLLARSAEALRPGRARRLAGLRPPRPSTIYPSGLCSLRLEA